MKNQQWSRAAAETLQPTSRLESTSDTAPGFKSVAHIVYPWVLNCLTAAAVLLKTRTSSHWVDARAMRPFFLPCREKVDSSLTCLKWCKKHVEVVLKFACKNQTHEGGLLLLDVVQQAACYNVALAASLWRLVWNCCMLVEFQEGSCHGVLIELTSTVAVTAAAAGAATARKRTHLLYCQPLGVASI